MKSVRFNDLSRASQIFAESFVEEEPEIKGRKSLNESIKNKPLKEDLLSKKTLQDFLNNNLKKGVKVANIISYPSKGYKVFTIHLSPEEYDNDGYGYDFTFGRKVSAEEFLNYTIDTLNGYIQDASKSSYNEDLSDERYNVYVSKLSDEIRNLSRFYRNEGISLEDVLRALDFIAVHYEDLADIDDLLESYNGKKITNSTIVEAISKLLEASMSDEDKRDSEIIRNLYKKIDGKQYKKFTPEEQEIIDKYGLDAWGFRGDTAIVTPGKNDVVKNGDLGKTSWNGKRFIPNKDADKINFADRARKTDSRDWGRKYSNINDTYKQEYERADQAREMQRPYDEFKSAKSRYNYSKSKLDDYYNDLAKQIAKADDEYIQNTNSAILTRQNQLKSNSSNLKNSQTVIDDLLNKHRKAVKEALRQLSLKEAMSDEDRKDSKILRDILSKIDKRSNARLTPEENAILDKYNIKRLSRGLRGPNTSVGLDYYQDAKNLKNPEYNLAGKFRTGDREYANTVKRYGGWGDTFQTAERDRESDVMGKDVSSMKNALDSRKYWIDRKEKAELEYNDAMDAAKANRERKIAQLMDLERYKGYRNQAEKDKTALNDVRRKYGLKTEESLKEGWGDDYDRVIPFNGDAKKNQIILDSIQGQMSDGIWENSPGMEKWWRSFRPVDGNVTCKKGDWTSPWAKMEIDDIRKYFANKAKYIAQLWMHDNRINPYKNWNADNTEECDYMNDGITVADMFEFFNKNK